MSYNPRTTLRSIRQEISRIESRMLPRGPLYPGYRDDPHGYIKDILGITLTPDMSSVVDALMRHPRRVLCSSGHSVGKTCVAGSLINWFHDTRTPGIVLTTAPTDRQVKSLLWKEVRIQRERAGLPGNWVGPKHPRMETGPDHFAEGFTARDGTRFQGHHSPGGLLIIFDEADGVDPIFWEAVKTMLDDESFFLALYNPVGQATGAHLAEQRCDSHPGEYTRLCLSSVDHPNISAQLAKQPLVIPGAITLAQLRSMLLEDSQLLTKADEKLPVDVQLGDEWFRPGPVAEARALGRRPTQSTSGVWYERLWTQMLAVRHDVHPEWPVVIGCDVGRYGDDATIIWVRKGLAMLHVEQHVKQSTKRTTQRIKEVCEEYGDRYNPPRRIPCNIDEGGIGSGVIDNADGYLFVPVNASCRPREPERYLNVRAELWFNARMVATENALDVSRIPEPYLQRLKVELLSAKYKILPGTDKIQVVSKDEQKALLKRSPDFADAFNLCVYPPAVIYG